MRPKPNNKLKINNRNVTLLLADSLSARGCDPTAPAQYHSRAHLRQQQHAPIDHRSTLHLQRTHHHLGSGKRGLSYDAYTRQHVLCARATPPGVRCGCCRFLPRRATCKRDRNIRAVHRQAVRQQIQMRRATGQEKEPVPPARGAQHGARARAKLPADHACRWPCIGLASGGPAVGKARRRGCCSAA